MKLGEFVQKEQDRIEAYGRSDQAKRLSDLARDGGVEVDEDEWVNDYAAWVSELEEPE